jgi:hypothetical protein
MFPLTLPSPARGEGKYIEIQEEIPSPSTGEGQGFGRELSRTVGVKMGFFHTFGEGRVGVMFLKKFMQRLGLAIYFQDTTLS